MLFSNFNFDIIIPKFSTLIYMLVNSVNFLLFFYTMLSRDLLGVGKDKIYKNLYYFSQIFDINVF